MSTIRAADIKETIEAGSYDPAGLEILPLKTKIGLKTELSRSLKVAINDVKSVLSKNYQEQTVTLISDKLDTSFNAKNMNPTKHFK